MMYSWRQEVLVADLPEVEHGTMFECTRPSLQLRLVDELVDRGAVARHLRAQPLDDEDAHGSPRRRAGPPCRSRPSRPRPAVPAGGSGPKLLDARSTRRALGHDSAATARGDAAARGRRRADRGGVPPFDISRGPVRSRSACRTAACRAAAPVAVVTRGRAGHLDAPPPVAGVPTVGTAAARRAAAPERGTATRAQQHGADAEQHRDRVRGRRRDGAAPRATASAPTGATSASQRAPPDPRAPFRPLPTSPDSAVCSAAVPAAERRAGRRRAATGAPAAVAVAERRAAPPASGTSTRRGGAADRHHGRDERPVRRPAAPDAAPAVCARPASRRRAAASADRPCPSAPPARVPRDQRGRHARPERRPPVLALEQVRGSSRCPRRRPGPSTSCGMRGRRSSPRSPGARRGHPAPSRVASAHTRSAVVRSRCTQPLRRTPGPARMTPAASERRGGDRAAAARRCDRRHAVGRCSARSCRCSLFLV